MLKGIILLTVLSAAGVISTPVQWLQVIPEWNVTYACETVYTSNKCQFEDMTYLPQACGHNLTTFMLMLQTVMTSTCDIADPCRRTGTNYIKDDEVYDFIIVGAGVAGPVIARRLAEQEPWWRVLLIEAGPEEPTMTAFPAFAFNAINSELDWNFETEPTQPHPTACLKSGGRCTWPRGKMVSGTGGMYGMMYVRGHPEVYNRWAQAGNKGWSYLDVEHYFERAENPEMPGMTSGPPFQRTKAGGPVRIEYFPYKPPFGDEILRAASELGYRTSELYGERQTGFMVAPMMTQGGLRGTTSRFYLRPIVHKSNLKVLTNARVTRIIKNPWTKNAWGIELIDKYGVKRRIKADKEVILTAGAVGSPQILLSSGIGPREDLRKVGITLYHELPVGRNLHNHVSVGLKMSINDTFYEDITLEAVKEYLSNRTGPLTSTGLTQVTAFLESSFAIPGVPDIQIFFDGYSSPCPKTGQQNECFDGNLQHCPMRREISARPTAVVIKSRGVLTLRSANPLDRPVIYPNYFTDQEDLKVLIEGVKKVIELTKTHTMRKWDLRLDETILPACAKYPFGTDAYWECYIRMETGPENHQSGTCKMGPKTDPDAVVDSELRLHGISNIRVADASIFPDVPNANPCAAIIMVAEKAADMIINTWEGL
ncbi:glucose dehydrogenase [FAD, quinone]-like [Microplitis mediator]|uniref:glucose dehydrogenase [FAD, quinone]-like n=1 Tax=Microplitis mediator TaxID=375433 RepID=UPI0025529236|nr:glucose dehydrogenase [FAD, quinone]-like [Microplitis mediator]